MSHLKSILCAILTIIFFVCSMGAAAGQNKADRKDILTQKEREWLSSHDGLIRIGITEIPPQILRGEKEGDYKGLSIDYIRLMERHLGCKFQLVYYATWNELMQAAKSTKIDIIFAAQKTPSRSEYLLFSKPYIVLPNMIIVRKDMGGTFTLEKLAGLKIVCSEGSAVCEFLRANYGYLDLYPVKDEMSGLIKVSFGEADAMVVEISRASYDIEKAGITNLRVAGNTGFTYNLRFASRKDWPILNRILDKGLSSISLRDRDTIIRKWIAISPETIFASRTFWVSFVAGLSVITLIFIAIIFWNRTLKEQVAQRTMQLQEELLERKRADEERRRLEERLQRAEKMEALGTLAGGVAHDLNNVLGIVVGYSEMLLDDLETSSPERSQAMEILRGGQRAIIVSGFAETERVSKAQALGAGAYVKKPYLLEKLGLAVRKELGHDSGRHFDS